MRNTLLDLIAIVDNLPLDFERNHSPYYRLLLPPDDPRPHGFIHPDTVARMPWPDAFFSIDDAAASVTIKPAPDPSATAAHINAALQQAVDAAIDGDVFPTLNRMHSEPFRIPGTRATDAIVHVERFAASLFGIATRGAHMTCYTRGQGDGGDDGDEDLRIWVARRHRNLFTYPGKLDSTVAGGVKATDTPTGCIVAESEEEASLTPAQVRARARPTGVVTLANRNPRTGLVHGEVLYTYDMEMMPWDAPPTLGHDGEVEDFSLMDAAEVRRRMEAGEFKPNVCAIMIDFLIRHGVVTPESEGEAAYVAICNRLRRRLPMPTAPDGP